MLELLKQLATAKTAFCEKLNRYVLIDSFSSDEDNLLLIRIIDPASKKMGWARPEQLSEFA